MNRSDLLHLYFFGTMSKRKILSSFQRETDKIIDEREEKSGNKFHKGKNDARLPNSKPCNFQTKWLNEHKWLCSVPCCYLFIPLQRQQRDKLSPEAVKLAQNTGLDCWQSVFLLIFSLKESGTRHGCGTHERKTDCSLFSGF